MVGYHPEERLDAALVTVPTSVVPDGTASAALVAAGTVPLPVTPPPRVPRSACPSPAEPRRGHRAGTPLPALGGEFLSAALDLLCRDEPLSRAEIGDHADVVAEVADALASVADRLVRDLDALGPEAAGSSGRDLAGARDALQEGSSDSRRGAALLWARHLDELRAAVERARPAPSPAAVVPAPPRH